MRDKALSLLSIAAKAGSLVSGEFSVDKAVHEGRAALVVVAADASDNTRKKFTDMCAWFRVPIQIYADREMLGRSIGKSFRAVAAVTDEGLAKAVLKRLEEESRIGGNGHGKNEGA